MTTDKKDIVLLIQGQLQEFNARELCLKSYPHPKGYPMLVIDLNNKLYELQCTQPRKYSSWFINQRVSSGQNIYMASILDPRFICLPFLEKTAGRFSPLDQIVTMDEKYSRFPVSRAGAWKMDEVCDVNDKLGDDMLLYRYNETKLVAWLKSRVEAVAGVVKAQREAKASAQNTTFASGFNVSRQSTGVTAPQSAATDGPSREDLITALEIVTDYLTPASTDKLLAAFNMSNADLNASKSSAAANLKRKADWEQELELEQETLAYSAAATKVTSVGPVGGAVAASSTSTAAAVGFGASFSNGVGSKAAAVKVTAAAKANQVAAKGTKSIQSFFGGKK